MKRTFALLALFFLGYGAYGQTPTIQDCLGAIPVCQQIYTETISANGDGNYNNEINVNISCTAGELNSIWYTFTVNEPGELGFVITPNDPDDDYDWSLYDITNATCAEIRTNPSLQVSCNAAGGGGCHGATGATGATVYDDQGGGCDNFPPSQNGGFTPFNDRVPMQPGNTYVLMVSNWTGSQNGYTIDFGNSTGLGIIDETRPTIDRIFVPDQCGENTISVEFSENIQCSSLDDTNFQLTGPGGPYVLSPINTVCNAGGEYEKAFELAIDPPLSEQGDYTFALVTNESDEVIDLCNNPAFPFEYEFTIDFALDISLELGPDTSLFCVGETVIFDATVQLGTYLWQDGSTDPIYEVTTPGIYAVTATNDCGTLTDEIEVVYLQDVPQISLPADVVLCPGETVTLDVTSPFANYQWQDGNNNATRTVTTPGTYLVTVTNVCGSTEDEIVVDYISPIFLEFGPDIVLCSGEEAYLDAENEDVISYLWQDGSTGPEYFTSVSGTYSVTVTTDCEVMTDEITITFIEEPTLSLGPDLTLCSGETQTYDLSVPGATYQWSDGSAASTNTIATTGDYSVTVTTPCDIFIDNVSVNVLEPILTELGRDTFLCPGERIVLDASAGTQADYLWKDGSTTPTLRVNEPGSYSVVVSNQCETVTDQIVLQECEVCTIYVPNAFSPNDDGFNDRFRAAPGCEVVAFKMQIYDRWGALMFETEDVNDGWDGDYKGRPLTTGMYVWAIDYTMLENGNPKQEIITGGINLLR